MNPHRVSTIVLVAGESSGDQLGAALIDAIRAQQPDTQFAGIGGPLMKAAGMDCWWDSAELAIMGIAEIVKHIPRLLKLRKQLINKVVELQPDVFIGIDAPDFNLGVEKRLKARSISVIHYVSPTVWAWRPGRVKTIAASTERVLCLFPFEPACYPPDSVKTDYTGHPLADSIPIDNDADSARETLNLSSDGPYMALLPGSRLGEVEKLLPDMLEAAFLLQKRYPQSCFMIPAVSQQIRDAIETRIRQFSGLNALVFDSNAKTIMAAADVVVLASGTATLEVMLVNRPMVVCYRLAGTTYRMFKWLKLLITPYISLPNILANEELVPELLQDNVNAEKIAFEVQNWLQQPQRRDELKARFIGIHEQLRTDAAATAAIAVLNHIALNKASLHG